MVKSGYLSQCSSYCLSSLATEIQWTDKNSSSAFITAFIKGVRNEGAIDQWGGMAGWSSVDERGRNGQ